MAGSAVCEDPSQEALQALWDFFPGAVLGRAGKTLKKGDRYFIDQYNQEYSRDAEPMKDGHNDNYYYQMAANIRRFKGVRRLPAASAAVTIDLDRSFEQWQAVQPEYRDHLFETLPRDEAGCGELRYSDHSGRNEFVCMKVAADTQMVYFYAQTRLIVSPSSDPNWMMLFIDRDQDPATGWMGYDFLVNWPVISEDRTTVQVNRGGWRWDFAGEARYRVEGNQLMLAVPRAVLGMDSAAFESGRAAFENGRAATESGRAAREIGRAARESGRAALCFDFHWSDGLLSPGEEYDFLSHGDSAPNRRFNYRYGGESWSNTIDMK
jgi:hypothetical protein